MAKRRENWLWTSGLAAVLVALGGPLAAQTAPTATNSAAPVPTPAPAPADGSLIGPPQLRDFTLNGTVTRRAEPVTVPTPTPAPVRQTPSANRTPDRRVAPDARTPARTSPAVAAPDRNASADAVSVDLPAPTPASPAAITPVFRDSSPVTTTPAVAEEGRSWPWLLALLAAALGAGFLMWRKRRATAGGYSYAGASQGAASPEAAPLPRAASARPTAPPAQRPTSPPSPAANGGIVATGLRPRLGFELRPIRAETDDSQGGALLFDVIVINNGHAPARDVLVEAQLVNAGPQQDEQIGRFFREPVGKGERLPVIPPMGRIMIKNRLTISPEQMRPVEVDGRKLFVPLVAFNALYRWSGGDEQDSASFLVGRDKDDGGKMAPFRLDQGAKSWTGLGARPHSMGLQRQPAQPGAKA